MKLILESKVDLENTWEEEILIIRDAIGQAIRLIFMGGEMGIR